ncbi:MAG: cation:proton antiporter [Lachnospiraceae bacterium]|nr:cation:proton antiporter [Lachnospiraceae bacterium]
MTVENAYIYLFTAALIWFALLITVGLIRAIIGPRITDRVLSINMISTMVISCIAILAVYLKESYLVDVALIYAMVSFVSVLILISIYLPGRTVRTNESEEKDVSEEGSAGSDNKEIPDGQGGEIQEKEKPVKEGKKSPQQKGSGKQARRKSKKRR